MNSATGIVPIADAEAGLVGTARPVDGVVRMAALALDAPIALATLGTDVREQPAVLARHGLDRAPARLPLCAQVAASGLPMVVADLAAGGWAADEGVAAYAGFPVRDGDGQAVGALCVADRRARDWTARELAIVEGAARLAGTVLADDNARLARHALAAAEAGQAFLSALLDSLDTGVAACDAGGRLVLFNRALREMVGGDAAESLPEEWRARFHVQYPDGRPVPAEELPLVRALRDGEDARGVALLIGAHGRHVLVNGHAIEGPDGRRLGAVSAVHDMTARRAAARLRDCELRISYALSGAADAAAAGRAVLEIVGETFGWSRAELWLREPAGALRCAATWGPTGGAAAVRGERLAEQAAVRGEPIWRPDTGAAGGPLLGTGPRAALALPVRSGETVTGVLEFFADQPRQADDPIVALLSGVAAHLGQYLERRRADELRLALARSKDEYIALVGHELRTPLTSISSYADLLAGHPPETPLGELAPLVEVVQRNAAVLRGIIDDLLDLAALDSGHLTLHPQPVDLAALTAEATAATRPGAAAAGIALEERLARTGLAYADPGRLRQIVAHLLGNAVKYSPDGGTITVTTAVTGDRVGLTVSDTGIGLGAEDADAVFRRFHRSRLARDHNIPGSGLGLPFCRTVAERHGGDLTLANRPGGGAVATLTLPALPEPA